MAIKAHCLPSLKASSTDFTFLAMKQNGTVVAAECSCVAGQGESCSCTDFQFGRQNESEGLASPC